MSLEIRAHVNMELINFNSLKILKFKGFKMKNHTAISINKTQKGAVNHCRVYTLYQ